MNEHQSALEAALADLRTAMMAECAERHIEGPAYNRLLGHLDRIDKLAADLRQERDFYGAQFNASEDMGDMPCEF